MTLTALDVATELRRAVGGEVDTSSRRRAEYSSDASNYRVVPEVVVFPRDVDDVLAVAEVSRETGAPLTTRGGGTSVAGNAVGPGIVMDLSRHVNRIIELDPEARTATVEPGVIMGSLQQAAAPHGLRFGPDPSTWARATIGGMIGNNACGSHSLVFGTTADNVLDLDVVDGLGRQYSTAAASIAGIEDFTQANLGVLRTELGRFGRQVSGYGLHHLLPENGRNLTRALVGSEGTLAVTLGATVTLVPVPVNPLLLVLGYPTMADAADAVPAIIAHGASAIEGLDARLVDAVRRAKGAGAVAHLPEGDGWLLIEVAGPEGPARADAIARDAAALSSRLFSEGRETRAIWRIREDGVGLAGRTAAGEQAWPGFEDAAVPPEHLGAYLREFEQLLDGYGVSGMPYGHFGDGCIHVRLDIPLERDGSVLRELMTDAARLVASHGGSLSGEHGDGRARSELLPIMYSPELIGAFGQFRRLFDPRGLLNPGVLVDPSPLDASLRRPQALPIPRTRGFALDHDGGDFTKAVHRCVGIGKCRADNTAAGGFMCPSYLATGDEKDSTRGRARVLQEMANGTLVTGGWQSPEVQESLDLCLSCKACASDCPAGVDMAAYKSEALFRRYEGRMRPVTHYVLGWLPRWARLASPFARILNPLLQWRPLQRAVLWAGGMDARRSIPRFADRSFSRKTRRSRWRALARQSRDQAPKVLVWVDSFSDNFSPSIAHASVAVLEAAGYEVITPKPVCCGLTWITTGQLTAARAKLSALLDEFTPYVDAGVPILGLEPSCTAVLRSDLLELLPDDPRAARVAAATHTLAELLAAPAPIGPGDRWSPPSLAGTDVLVQPHCHQHAVMGFDADTRLLAGLGASVTALAGCCGLAGNFGMEKGHYEVSVAVAENALLPALRSRATETVFLADGFSCRTQADQLGATRGLHLAELLAEALPI